MLIAEKLGMKFHPSGKQRCQEILDNKIDALEHEIQADRHKLTAEANTLKIEDARLVGDIRDRGNVSYETALSNLYNAIWISLFLIVSASGEFLLAHWTFDTFGLDPIYTIIISAGFLIMSMKIFDLYLSLVRKEFPAYDNLILLSLSGFALILIFLVFLFGSDIREQLYQMINSLEFSLEDQVEQSNKIESNNSITYLMVTLGLATIIISGLSYHLSKTLVWNSWPLIALYRKLNRTRRRMKTVHDELSDLPTIVPEFVYRFWKGFENEELKENHGVQSDNSQTVSRIIIAFLLPVTLIAISLVIFLAVRAGATDYQVYFDTSSSGMHGDYEGKQTEFVKNIKAVEDFLRNSIRVGDSIKIVAITENSFTKPLILIDTKITKGKGRFKKNHVLKQKLALVKKWNSFKHTPQSKGTDIFGAMHLASILFKPGRHKKHLIVFSDMRNVSHGYNFEKIKEPHSVFSKVKKKGLVPDLAGINVSCLGVHTAGGFQYWNSLKRFWKEYFANAKTFTFSIERRLP